MASSSQKSEIFDEIRGIFVAATPEELIRQALLQKMCRALGYPKELIAVERELSQLPHLRGQRVPARRLDILCFDKKLRPLLLIECKKQTIDRAAKEQLLGYNSFVQARFVALASQDEVLFGYRQNVGFEWLPFLPPYTQLTQQAL